SPDLERELGEAVGDHLILQRHAADAADVRLASGVRAAHAEAEPFDLAAAVVDQMQPRPPAIGNEAREHDLAPEQPQAAPLVGEPTPDLQREATGIGGVRPRELGAPDLDGE